MQSAKRNVVLVHGIWMKPFMLRFIGNRLKRAGYQVYYFSYSSIFRSVEENLISLHRFISGIENGQLFLVGHSLGGLMILEYLKQFKTPVTAITLVASPINGNRVAKVLRQRFYGRLVLGKSMELLETGVSDSGVPTAMIAGTLGIGMGRLFTRVEKPCDGAVSIKETQAPWLEHHWVVRQSHTGTLVSPTVARLIISYLDDKH